MDHSVETQSLLVAKRPRLYLLPKCFAQRFGTGKTACQGQQATGCCHIGAVGTVPAVETRSCSRWSGFKSSAAECTRSWQPCWCNTTCKWIRKVPQPAGSVPCYKQIYKRGLPMRCDPACAEFCSKHTLAVSIPTDGNWCCCQQLHL